MAKTVRLGFAMEATTRDGLLELARQEGRSVSDILRRLVEARIARLKRRHDAPSETRPAP
jgi:hypothetical protein